jgi:hypothetical protein
MNLTLFKMFATGMVSMLLNLAVAQQNITISGNDVHEAMIYNNTRPGYEYTRDANYGSHPRIAAVAWTNSGYASYFRSLLSFDLSAIPSGSVIESATLYFYSDPTVTGSSDANGNSQLSGSNAIYLEKVTSAWDEYTVTWNTQPATTTTDRVWVGPSVSTTENLEVDISTLVQGWVNDPQSNNGLKMILENEVYYRSRNYASTDHSNTSIHPKLVISFVPPDPETSLAYKNEIESIFQHVDRSYVNTGLLSDYGLFFTNIEKFNGVPADTNYIEYGEWQMLYTSLFSSRFNTNASLQEPARVFDEISNAAVANRGIILLPGMHFNYERFKENALSDNLVYISDDKIYDTHDRPSTPYEPREAFAIVPTRSSLSGGTYSFMFRPDLFYSNTGKTISSVEADFADGAGNRNLTPDAPENVTYSDTGEKTILFRVNYTDGSYKESRTKIEVKDISETGARYAGVDTAQFRFPRPDFHAPREYLGEIAGAWVTVEYTNPDRIIRKPLIVVEGFHPWNILTPEDPGENFSFADLISGRTGGLNRVIDYTHPVSGAFYATLSDALEGEQYDLIFIDFADGTDHIQRNAFLVENVIEWVNDRKQPFDGVMQQNVVVGFSLGGVIARYALRDMEDMAIPIPHDTRLYVSFDSPHQGANVPVGFQAMVSHLNGKGIGFGLPGLITVNPGGLTFGRLVPQLGRAFEMLNTPAARQILRYQVNGTGSLIFDDNSRHTEFMNSYRELGYPVLEGIRSVVIANGSECGIDQGYAPYAEFLNVNQTLATIPWWGTVLSSLFSPLFLLTNYPQWAIGDAFTTRSDVKGKFIVNALPDQSAQRIYYGEVYLRKKILWTINVNISLFSKAFNSDPSYLPLDNSSGGINDIRGTVGSLPIPFNITRFNFMPTFSSLDIGGGTQTILNSDLTRAYSPASPPPAPKNVVAANFFTNPTESGISNQIHTQITLRNGRWLFQEIEQMPAFFSCSYVCEGTATSPNITGPNEICAEDATYTLNNPSGAANFTWDRSSNLNYISGQGTQTYTVSRNANGNGFVQVVLGGTCGNSNPITKNITVGGVGYNSSDYPVTGPSSACTDENVLYSTNYLPLATYYSWFWPSDWTYLEGQGTRFLNLHVTAFSNSGTIGVRVATACDEGGSPATLFTSVSSCGSFTMSAYPNPAQVELIIESSEGSTTQSAKTADYRNGSFSFSAKLYDLNGQLRKTGNSKDGKIIMKTTGLPNGQYYLHIITDVEAVASQIIIKREK